MNYHMAKKTLDTWGGVGSILAGFACIIYAQQHHENPRMWWVWIGMCVILVLNGAAMLYTAYRAQPHTPTPAGKGAH